MNRKIKLIWDLFGIETQKKALDHAANLKYFATKEKLHYYKTGSESLTDNHAVAYIVVDEKDMITFRDALKPQRAEVAKD